jgi:hypothetical protein
VPYKFVGKTVDVLLDGKLVKILFDGETVAIHTESHGSGEFITNRDHFPKFKNFDLKGDEYRFEYRDRMNTIGKNAAEMFELLLIRESKHWYRTASGILHLKKLYPDAVIDAACKRAIGFNLTTLTAVKSICKSGSYILPMEETRHETIN